MKILKIMQTLIIAGSLFMNTSCTAAAETEKIKVELDGRTISFDVEPQVIDGRTMVPLRKIFEELGALVKWDDETQTISARKSSKTITFTINSSNMQIDKGKTDEEGNAVTETVTLDVPAQIVQDRTLVPIRAVSEAFGLDVEWDENTSKVTISSNDDSDESWKENTGEINLNDLTYTGDGISISENKITITKGGDFTLSGTMTGSITVNTEERVKLRLNNAAVSSDGEPCIYFEKTDKAFITVEDGTENNLISSNCEDGAIYSKENLEIKGGGTLTVKSDTGHGIKASDNLTIEDGTININAARDGININDTFKMTGGDLTVESEYDGIASDSIVIIEDGKINIKTTEQPINSSELNTDAESTDTEPDNQRPGKGFMQETPSAEFENSSKGIKADWMMVISGGNITIDSTDHSVHCADEIEINGGTFSLNSVYGKGISCHGNVTVDGTDTEIDVTKSTEGIESKNVLKINNGYINIVSSDDSLNGTGEESGTFDNMSPPKDRDDNFAPPENEDVERADGKSQNDGGRKAPENMPEGFERDYKDTIIINDGNIELNAGDDCIDTNGNIVLNGGIIKATHSNGGIVSFTGALDADGSITIGEEATLVTATRSGDLPTLDSSQNAVVIYTDTQHNSGDVISVKNTDGEIVLEYIPKSSFQTVFVVSPKFENDKTYTVTIGDETHDIIMSGGIVTVGEAQNGGFGGMGGGIPGGRENRDRQPETE